MHNKYKKEMLRNNKVQQHLFGNFFVRLSMDGLFLEASAHDIMHRIDGNKGSFVLFQGYVLQLAHLKTGNDAVEHLLASPV